MRFENRSQLPHIHWLFFARLERFSYVFFAPSFFLILADNEKQPKGKQSVTNVVADRSRGGGNGRGWAVIAPRWQMTFNDFSLAGKFLFKYLRHPATFVSFSFFWTLEKKFVFSKCVCCLKLICWSAKSLIDLPPLRPLCFWVNLHGHGFDWV